jgi:phosphodiesterase/alkaline phosphatase D-like protein
MTKLFGIALVTLLACGLAIAQTGSSSPANAALPSTSMEKPQITNGPVAELVSDSACTIGWSTTAPAKMTVRYGTDRTKLTQTAEAQDARDPRNHHVQLTGLTPNTRYYFQVLANGEPMGNPGTFSTVDRGDSPVKSKATIPQ